MQLFKLTPARVRKEQRLLRAALNDVFDALCQHYDEHVSGDEKQTKHLVTAWLRVREAAEKQL